MVELPLADAFPAACSYNLLHSFEQLWRDQRLVAPLELFALVGDQPHVVAILEHAAELRGRHGALWIAPRSSPQTPVGQGLDKLCDAVVAGGIELEGQGHKCGPLRIKNDRSNLVSFEVFPNVAVAKGRPSEGPALACLFAHLVGDVGSISSGTN